MLKPKISFLASHGGSSAKAIIKAIEEGKLEASLGILITNNVDSAIHQWCIDNGFPVHHVSAATHGLPQIADATIMSLLKEVHTDLVVCSGYMKQIGPVTLHEFSGQILNIHPALLPNHGGQGMYGDNVHKAVLKAGDKESGATVHVVTENYDEGPTIAQSHVEVLADDTLESLRQRVQATEPKLYIEAIKSILSGEKNRLLS